MLKETYYNSYKGWGFKPPKDSVVIHVDRSSGYILSPSWKLLNEYKGHKINWNEYVRRFKEEMSNEVCINKMKEIKELAKEKDVYLVCYCSTKRCHRFLLMDIIEKM